MSGQRGDISAHEYEVYCQKVMSWNIPDSRKQKIVDQIYAKWSEQLRHEAAHVSVAVAGPARYNAKKLDHSDTILRLSSEFVEWFNGLQEQVWQGRIEDKDAKEIARLVDDIKFCIERPTLNPTESLCELANKDPELFMEYYEKLHEKYRWRKNSVIAKLYAAGKEGKLAKLNRQKFFEDENLVAYTMGDRAYIKFVMKPRQQLIVALKSRKWWWNSNEEAWSTYLNKLDKEWVQSISTRYAGGRHEATYDYRPVAGRRGQLLHREMRLPQVRIRPDTLPQGRTSCPRAHLHPGSGQERSGNDVPRPARNAP